MYFKTWNCIPYRVIICTCQLWNEQTITNYKEEEGRRRMWLACREATFALRSLSSEKTSLHWLQMSERRKWNSPIHGVGLGVVCASWRNAQGTVSDITLRKDVCRSTRVARGYHHVEHQESMYTVLISPDTNPLQRVHCEPRKALYTDATSGESFRDDDRWWETQMKRQVRSWVTVSWNS